MQVYLKWLKAFVAQFIDLMKQMRTHDYDKHFDHLVLMRFYVFDIEILLLIKGNQKTTVIWRKAFWV